MMLEGSHLGFRTARQEAQPLDLSDAMILARHDRDIHSRLDGLDPKSVDDQARCDMTRPRLQSFQYLHASDASHPPILIGPPGFDSASGPKRLL